MSSSTLRQLELRLIDAVSLYQRRLDWLTTGSRRLCGVISEQSICLVLDVQLSTVQQLDLFNDMMICLLNEQISQLSHFNIVW